VWGNPSERVLEEEEKKRPPGTDQKASLGLHQGREDRERKESMKSEGQASTIQGGTRKDSPRGHPLIRAQSQRRGRGKVRDSLTGKGLGTSPGKKGGRTVDPGPVQAKKGDDRKPST